jgi:hypothetical protein
MARPSATKTAFGYGILNAITAQVGDLEDLRIALDNRYRIMVTPRDELDKDGIARGFGIDPNDDELLGPLRTVKDGVASLEVVAIRAVERFMRNSPWRQWLDNPHSKGVGAKQLARLLGTIGDPYWHGAEDRPRMVSELWSYCGLSVVDIDDDGYGVAPRRKRGEKSTWSEEARKRAWLIATSCVKSGGHYREVYDRAKRKYANTIHKHTCIRCGPSGKPAQVGTPLSAGHIHARALRAVMKAVLRDLWHESRRMHGVLNDEDGLVAGRKNRPPVAASA